MSFEFVRLVKLKDSPQKFEAVVFDKKNDKEVKIKFGDSRFENYTSGHLDEKRRDNYIARHRKREDWTKSGVLTRGFWAYHILWNKKTFKEALDNIKQFFK